jgi:hypothetical protein
VKEFNPKQPVGFRHAPEKVRILATDLKFDLPIVIAVLRDDGREEIRTRHPDGRVNPGRDSPYDLVNVPKKHEVWINFYDDDGEGDYDSYSYPSRAIADESADSNRIACIRVEFTEGEGL